MAIFDGHIKVQNGDMMVYNNGEWASTTTEDQAIKQFEQHCSDVHNKHESVRIAWEEYKTIRRLAVGK